MAEYKMGEEQTAPIQVTPNGTEPIDVHTDSIEDSEEETVQLPSDRIKGLSPEELKDPNQISVEIADTKAPIVVLFGPPQCGKTMTLVRLTRYLMDKEYTVEPVSEFRPTYDTNYSEICENFNMMMNQNDAAQSTSKISFMLVKVSKNSKTICQILEAPGEYYFNPESPLSAFPGYFNTITSGKNRKIWAIFVEPKWGETEDRKNYVTRMDKLKKKMKKQDKVIIVFNKIDKSNFLIDGDGHVNIKEARGDINSRYPNLFDKFKNTVPIIRWFTPYNFEFCPFQTGDYSRTENKKVKFQPGPEAFPRKLWKIILDKVRG